MTWYSNRLTTWCSPRLAMRLLLAPLLSFVVVLVENPTVEADDRLVVGKIAQASTKHLNRLNLLAGYLARSMVAAGEEYGVRRGGVKIVSSVGEMSANLRNGRIDILSETAFSALQLVEDGHAEFLLVEWKRGRPAYRSVFFVRADSSIKKLSDLAGKRIALEDPNSTSAFFLPLAELRDHGIGAIRLDAPDAPISDDKVGYLFAHQEIGQAVMVTNGLADAGVFSDEDWSKLSAGAHGIADDLRIIHRTEEVFRSAVLVRKSLRPAVKDLLKKILLEMPSSDAGRKVLASYYQVTSFETPSGESAQMVDRTRALYRQFQEAR